MLGTIVSTLQILIYWIVSRHFHKKRVTASLFQDAKGSISWFESQIPLTAKESKCIPGQHPKEICTVIHSKVVKSGKEYNENPGR
jgi:hypothetical protein